MSMLARLVQIAVSRASVRQFRGIPQRGELTLDFGLDGAVLFGGQKTKTQHQTSAVTQAAFSAGNSGSLYFYCAPRLIFEADSAHGRKILIQPLARAPRDFV
jgi:hypothetical protein